MKYKDGDTYKGQFKQDDPKYLLLDNPKEGQTDCLLVIAYCDVNISDRSRSYDIFLWLCLHW